jgi:hypothetical protein
MIGYRISSISVSGVFISERVDKVTWDYVFSVLQVAMAVREVWHMHLKMKSRG